MAKVEQDVPQEEKPPIPCEEIADKVKKELPMPGSLHSILAKHLWANRYRVNIYATEKDNSIFGKRIYMHSSYFLKVTTDGQLVM